MEMERTLTMTNIDRDRIIGRCKQAPAALPGGNFIEALEAWHRYQRYRGMADSAFTKYMQAGIGTETQRRHHSRYLAYSDVADGWERAIENWFKWSIPNERPIT